MTTQSLIEEFLSTKRFAMIGVSRDPKDFSRGLFREFISRGYNVLPVNPLSFEIENKRCYGHIGNIEPPVTAALLMTPKKGAELIVRDCAEAGISLIWLYGISGEKDINSNAVQFCRENGIRVIPGYCPFMFLPAQSWFHRLHGAAWKLLGKYPQ